MPFQLILPDIGEGVVEAEVIQWFVRQGDEVAEDQPVVEVMTDKATVTIPSPRKGRILRLLFEEGATARVHEPLVEIEVDSAAPGDTAPGAMKGSSSSTDARLESPRSSAPSPDASAEARAA